MRTVQKEKRGETDSSGAQGRNGPNDSGVVIATSEETKLGKRDREEEHAGDGRTKGTTTELTGRRKVWTRNGTGTNGKV